MNPGRTRSTRRTHSREFKQSVVEASRQPGASIAGVAMAHGINANQLHTWRRQSSAVHGAVAVVPPSLLPVAVVPDTSASTQADDTVPGRIDIELSGTRISLTGRVDLDVLHTVLTTLRPR